jgi:hypothetical protein
MRHQLAFTAGVLAAMWLTGGAGGSAQSAPPATVPQSAPQSAAVSPATASATSVSAVAPGASTSAASAATDTAANSRAASLVDQALTAAAHGDLDQRDTLLAQAIAAAPHYDRAHWAAGQVRSGGAWLTVGQAEAAAAADPKLAQYEQLRQKKPNTAEGEQALALWCAQHHLEAEGKWHWRSVLAHNPEHRRALKELGLHNYNGALLSTAERTTAVEKAKKLERANEKWKSRLRGWQHDLAGKDHARRRAAIAHIQQITDPDVVLVFEALVDHKSADDSAAFSLEMVRALGNLNDPKVTSGLVRQAIFSRWDETRQAAIAGLRQRELTDYVPEVMGLMLAPVERTSAITKDAEGTVYYEQQLFRPGCVVDDFRVERSVFTLAHLEELKSGDVSEWGLPIPIALAQDHARALQMAMEKSALDQLAVDKKNSDAAIPNANAIELLSTNGKVDCGAKVQDWWDWWGGYNELATEATRPQNTTYGYHQFSAFAPCCFKAGTQVSTLTGLVSIEKLAPGDRVLAADPQTGELGYKLVLARTIRPPSPLRKLTIGDEEILTTRGHRFWQLGRGWQMSKELASGALLYTGAAPVSIDAAEDAADDQAYNLTVEDFHTYFVGEHRLLVHDNSVPKPVLGPMPGLHQSSRY